MRLFRFFLAAIFPDDGVRYILTERFAGYEVRDDECKDICDVDIIASVLEILKYKKRATYGSVYAESIDWEGDCGRFVKRDHESDAISLFLSHDSESWDFGKRNRYFVAHYPEKVTNDLGVYGSFPDWFIRF